MEDKLHIGCFDRVIEGWYNTDITPHLWIARLPGAAWLLRAAGKMSDERFEQHQSGIFRKVHYLNIGNRFPLPDNQFAAVFCSHVLEHIHPDLVPNVFHEVLRILRPGGIFRVVVPDLDLAIRTYRPDAPDECLDMIFENRHDGLKNIHKWMYTRQSLQKVFERTGYTAISQESYRTGRLPELELIDNRPENSIYVEGQKGV